VHLIEFFERIPQKSRCFLDARMVAWSPRNGLDRQAFQVWVVDDQGPPFKGFGLAPLLAIPADRAKRVEESLGSVVRRPRMECWWLRRREGRALRQDRCQQSPKRWSRKCAEGDPCRGERIKPKALLA